LAEARSLEGLRQIEPRTQVVYRRCLDELDDADINGLAIHCRVSRLRLAGS
jgi:hypothetical protein